MSDTTTTITGPADYDNMFEVQNVAPVNSDAATLSEIDRMVSASKASTQPTQSVLGVAGRIVQHDTPDMRYSPETGTVQVINPASVQATRIHDDPTVDPHAQLASIEADINFARSRLDEVKFDPRSGAKSLVLPEGSEERTKLGYQIASLKNSLQYSTIRAAQIVEQRRLDKEASQRTNAEELQRLQFAGGNKERADALTKALLEEEARVAAAAIVANRNRR